MAQHKKNNQTSPLTSHRANFINRLSAYFIDLIVVTILMLVATCLAVLFVYIANKIGGIELGADNDISNYLARSLIFIGYLAAIIIAYYGYFWSRTGQTIGLKVCHLKVQHIDGNNITFTQAVIRMATSALGLGNFLALFYPHNAFQDAWAECEVIMMPRKS